jgi:hypothetical protein
MTRFAHAYGGRVPRSGPAEPREADPPVRYTDVLVSRIAARTLCDFGLRTASGPEGSSAK